MKKFLNAYRIDTNRSKSHDYCARAKYFITIETERMKKYFGEIVQAHQGASQYASLRTIEETSHGTSILLSQIGAVAYSNLLAIPQHFPFVQLDAFQIMPNHIHMILFFNPKTKTKYEVNEFKSKKGALGTVLNLYKGSVTRFAKDNHIEFQWKSRYHDIIIRNELALQNIRNYIRNNPANWIKKYPD